MRTVGADLEQGGAEAVGRRVASGEGLVSCLDLHGAVAPCGSHELLDAPARLGSDVVADGHGDNHDDQVSFDGIAQAW